MFMYSTLVKKIFRQSSAESVSSAKNSANPAANHGHADRCKNFVPEDVGRFGIFAAAVEIFRVDRRKFPIPSMDFASKIVIGATNAKNYCCYLLEKITYA